MHCDPEHVKEIFTAAPEDLHPGEGARVLEPLVGAHSVILLDEGRHMEQRKLLLPAFHGEKMQRLSGLMEEVAEREIHSWPRGEPLEMHERMQRLTLEIILRAVFGLDPGPRMEALRERARCAARLRRAADQPRAAASRGPRRKRRPADRALRDLLEAAGAGRRADLRADRGATGRQRQRDDILSLLLEARHEDGSPMSSQELRDELMTMLVAGHETTATSLAWAFERLTRTPAVLDRLVDEIRSDGDEDAYLTATIQETLRRRPVLPNAAPRLTMRELELGGWTYPAGVSLVANSYLLHHDPEIYPDPYAFRPERFLDEPPGTYTWTPFGGGRRRCIGASFAMVEMKIVLRGILANCDLVPPVTGPS